MSKKKIPTFCLVIDASISHAAGSLESKHPTGTQCRDFLLAVRSVCHRMAWTDAIKAEWDIHSSKFAMQWLVSMTRLKKIRFLDVSELNDIRQEINQACLDKEVATIVLKDCHLIEAAVATDLRVVSRDEAVRFHLSRLSVACLRDIAWVNPTLAEEKAVKWLERGAPMEKKRCLRKG